MGLGTLLRIKPRARRSFLTKERPSGDALAYLSGHASSMRRALGQRPARGGMADVLARQADRCPPAPRHRANRSTRTAELARTGMVVDTRLPIAANVRQTQFVDSTRGSSPYRGHKQRRLTAAWRSKQLGKNLSHPQSRLPDTSSVMGAARGNGADLFRRCVISGPCRSDKVPTISGYGINGAARRSRFHVPGRP